MTKEGEKDEREQERKKKFSTSLAIGEETHPNYCKKMMFSKWCAVLISLISKE